MMRQRLALALQIADNSGDGTPDYPELADAVFAVMADPTDHMIAAATDLGPNATLRDQWRATSGARWWRLRGSDRPLRTVPDIGLRLH